MPYWVTTGRGPKAVQELAANKVDIIKIWVDDRDGKYKKLTPELYGAVIDEAHKHELRVTAHIFTLEDAKGLLQGRPRRLCARHPRHDVDDEVMALFKARPNVVLIPNCRTAASGPTQLAEGQRSRRGAAEAAGGRHRSAAAQKTSASRRATWRSRRPA